MLQVPGIKIPLLGLILILRKGIFVPYNSTGHFLEGLGYVCVAALGAGVNILLNWPQSAFFTFH